MPGVSCRAFHAGRFMPGASCRALHAGRFMPVASCRPLHAGRFMPAASCRPLHAGRFMPAASCRPLHAGRFMPAVSCRPLHAGRFMPAASCRPFHAGRFMPAASCRTGSADVSRAGHRGPTTVHAGDAPRLPGTRPAFPAHAPSIRGDASLVVLGSFGLVLRSSGFCRSVRQRAYCFEGSRVSGPRSTADPSFRVISPRTAGPQDWWPGELLTRGIADRGIADPRFC